MKKLFCLYNFRVLSHWIKFRKKWTKNFFKENFWIFECPLLFCLDYHLEKRILVNLFGDILLQKTMKIYHKYQKGRLCMKCNQSIMYINSTNKYNPRGVTLYSWGSSMLLSAYFIGDPYTICNSVLVNSFKLSNLSIILQKLLSVLLKWNTLRYH